MSQIIAYAHIAGGVVGIVSGAIALSTRKGSPLHRKSGNAFFYSMLLMAGLGSYLAFWKPESISVLNGLLTCYLVASSWLTVKRAPEQSGSAEYVGLFFVLGVAAGHFYFGNEASLSTVGTKDGFPAVAFYTFGSISLFAGLMDARAIWKGGLSGAARLTRHLWRMCFAMFIATFSFFLGQPQVFPLELQESGVLALPVVAVVVAMVYWLITVKMSGKYRDA